MTPTAQQCRVAVFDAANQPLQLESVTLPDPRPGELLVRIDACTICGSDLHTIVGKRKEKSPTILGHEIVGTVEQVGQPFHDYNHDLIEPGDRVTWSVCMSCRQCSRCKSGIPQKCEQLKKVGHEVLDGFTGLLGGFAEYILLPKTASVFKLDAALDDEIICPANCATATTMAAFNKLGSIEDKSFLIVGAGLLGLTAIAYAKVKSASEIVVLDPMESRQQLALDFGADRSLENTDELDSAEKFDVVMDFSGISAAIESTVPYANLGCQIVLVGSVMPSPVVSVDPEFLVRNLISLHGVHNYGPSDLDEAIKFLTSQGTHFPFRSLVENSFELEKINEAIEFALANKPVRVMVRP